MEMQTIKTKKKRNETPRKHHIEHKNSSATHNTKPTTNNNANAQREHRTKEHNANTCLDATAIPQQYKATM